MTWPTIVLWLMVLVASCSSGPFIIYLFSGTIIFGALTMAPPGVTGGLNLPAQTICAAILILKIFVRSDNLNFALRQSLDIRKMGWLGFFIVYVLIISFLYPRLFRGSVMLYSENAAASESPLAPTSANFTQTTYLLVSVSITFAFAAAGRHPGFRDLYLRSVFFAAVLLIASGVINLALSKVGGLSLLEPFHNAAYSSLDTVSLAGQYRVVGFMPEASLYGGSTCTVLSFLVFNYRYFEPGLKRFYLPIVILALGFLTILSTSSTGYVGLITLILCAGGRLILSIIFIPVRSQKQFRRVTTLVASCVILIIVLAIVGPYVWTKYQNLLNVVLLSKTNSSSFLERSLWTHVGYQAFLNTYGFGVGIGSVRTSNWFVNILASSGVIGVVFLAAFGLKLLLPYPRSISSEDRRFSNSLKLCLVPVAVIMGISGTTPDPGVWVMAIFGILYSLKYQNLKKVHDYPSPYLSAGVGAGGFNETGTMV